MIQNYQDAMTICRYYGNLDLFITFTCNPKWLEITITIAIIPAQKIENRPDIIARVFKMKLYHILLIIKLEIIFRIIIADLYVVEFQKWGLHHFLFWLHSDCKLREPSQIDKFISTETPNPEKNPSTHNVVA